MKLNKTALATMMLLISAGCNANTDTEEASTTASNENIVVAVADGGPYAAPPPAGAKPKVVAPKEEGVKIYIPGQDDASESSEGEAKVEEGMVSDVGMSPLERVASTPKGKLKNPYTDDPAMEAEGQKRYMGNSCNGCHGGTGGGGMCPPLSNEVFVYGSDDDTLFRLITLGSDELQKAGYFRKGMEGVVGPMPPYGEIIETDAEVWQIIAWIRTVFGGDQSRRNW